MKRLLCAEAEIDSHKVNTGFLNKEDWSKLGRAAGALSQAKIFIDDTAGMSITEMRSKARRLSLEHGLDLLIVDYLQLMSGTNQRYENRTQEISQISRGLKSLAKEINIPVMAISQLNRAIESRRGDHRPQLSDLRESGSIEQDADMVIFIYREDIARPGRRKPRAWPRSSSAKQRNGPTGTFQLAFLQAVHQVRQPLPGAVSLPACRASLRMLPSTRNSDLKA